MPWLRRVQELGFRVCVISNGRPERVRRVGEALGLPAIAKAGKPSRSPFRNALTMMNATKERTAVVGDQVFTDVLGGRRMGLYTILVQPMARREFIGTRCVRQVEKLILHNRQPSR
jgi:HAD superfamily phosphatase (TIGR01668 family)